MPSELSFGTVLTKAEVLSGDLRKVVGDPQSVVGNVKLGWSTTVDWGKNVGSTLKANYDLRANRNFVKDISISGDASMSGTTLGYEVTQQFADGSLGDTTAALKLSTPAYAGMKLVAEYDTKSPSHIKSLALPMSYACGKVCKLTGKTEWLGAAKAMKYAATASFQSASRYATKLNAQISHKVEEGGPGLSYEVGVAQGVGAGRGLSATLKNTKVLALAYDDAVLDDQATWTFAWDMPLTSGVKDAFLQPTVKAKRKWSF